MEERLKVYAHITYGTKLLVFEEDGFPEGGIRIPGGTPEPDEDLESAALKEAIEETGLKSLKLVRYLGEALFDVSIYGLDEVHRRNFYHLECTETPPSNWNHEELYPSIRTEKTPEYIILSLYWWDLMNGLPTLQLGLDVKLPVLMRDLGLTK